jgi:hypothetical protein
MYAELNEMLMAELAEDGYSGVEIRKTPMRTEIIIRATRTRYGHIPMMPTPDEMAHSLCTERQRLHQLFTPRLKDGWHGLDGWHGRHCPSPEL